MLITVPAYLTVLELFNYEKKFKIICYYCNLQFFFFIEISCSTATSNLSPEKSSVSITQPVLLPRESSL